MRFLIPHFVLTPPSILFLAGDIVKLNLPEGMTKLLLNGTAVTGTQSRDRNNSYSFFLPVPRYILCSSHSFFLYVTLPPSFFSFLYPSSCRLSARWRW